MARKILLKENGLSGSTNTPDGYKYIGFENGSFSEKSGATVSEVGGGLTYQVVTGYFTQFNTNSPTLTILENTTGTNITASREFAGSTLIQSDGTPFTSNKTHISCVSGVEGQILSGRTAGTNLIVFRLFNSSGTLIDGTSATPKMFEIKIYP